jgi:hypothetical protein
LKRSEKRFVKELDVQNLLQQVRNSNVVINGLVRKEYLQALQFNKHRVIAANLPTDSSGEEMSSEGEAYTTN